MSDYTTKVRYICETKAGFTESQGLDKIDEIINSVWHTIFYADFPVFNEEYKKTLCCKILEYYYFREIGFNTVGEWLHHLNVRMKMIMPYYNDLYINSLSQRGLDIYETTNIQTKRKTDNTSDSARESKGNASGETRDRFSNTPQTTLEDIQNDTYLTSADINNTTTENTIKDTDHSTSENNTLETRTGKDGTQTYASMFKEYADTLINIDMMIIKDLENLFMGVW